jgi:hypothetical protein
MIRKVALFIVFIALLPATVPAQAQTGTPFPRRVISYDLQNDNCRPYCQRSEITITVLDSAGLWITDSGSGDAFGTIYLPANTFVRSVIMTGFVSFAPATSCRLIAIHFWDEPGYGSEPEDCYPIGQYVELTADINLSLSGWQKIFFYGLRAKSVTIIVGDPLTPTPYVRSTLAPFASATPRGGGCYLGFCDLIETPTLPPTSASPPQLTISRQKQVEMAQTAINIYRTMDNTHVFSKVAAFTISAIMIMAFIRMVLNMLQVSRGGGGSSEPDSEAPRGRRGRDK